MEQWAATTTGPHGAGRRRRGLLRPWLLGRGGSGRTTAPASTSTAATTAGGGATAAMEVKEAGGSYSPYGAGGRHRRAPFGPAFPGVGVAPTLVVARLPEYAVPPQQGAADIFPLAPSHQQSGGSSTSSGSGSSQPHHHHSSHSSHSGHSGHSGSTTAATMTDPGYDSDASTVMSEMDGQEGASSDDDDDEEEEEDDDFDDDMDDGGPPPVPCAFGRTQRVYVEREALVDAGVDGVGGKGWDVSSMQSQSQQQRAPCVGLDAVVEDEEGEGDGRATAVARRAVS